MPVVKRQSMKCSGGGGMVSKGLDIHRCTELAIQVTVGKARQSGSLLLWPLIYSCINGLIDYGRSVTGGDKDFN